MNRRVDAISVYEVVLCLFVILIHVLSEGVTGFQAGSLPSALFVGASVFVSFAVPGFIFSSGMKLCMKFQTVQLRYPSFLRGRIRKIYLPYLLWAVIYYLYFVFRLHYFPFHTADLLKYLLNGEISAQFYFIIVIMQFYLLMPLWLFLCRRFRPFALLAAGLALTVAVKVLLRGWQYNDRIFLSYLVFWLMGCCAGKLGPERFHKILKKNRGPLLLLWAVLAVLYVALQILRAWGKIVCPYPEPVTVLFCAAAIPGFYLLTAELAPKLPEKGMLFLRKIAGASYYIFLVHCLILTEGNVWLDRLGIHSLSVRFVLRSIFVYALSMLFCTAYCALKNRVRKL